MADWNDFDELVAPKARRCAVRTYLADLPDEGRAAVERSLESGKPIERIREALRVMRPGHGVPGAASWWRHRGGNCSCGAK
jgi:hypothetical protein